MSHCPVTSSRKASISPAKSSQLLLPGLVTREETSASTVRRRVVSSSFSQTPLRARRRPCAKNAASTSGCRPRTGSLAANTRKSGEAGSTAFRIALRRRGRHAARSLPSGVSSSGSSNQGAKPVMTRPKASSSEKGIVRLPSRRGRLARSVPASRFVTTGATMRSMESTQNARSSEPVFPLAPIDSASAVARQMVDGFMFVSLSLTPEL